MQPVFSIITINLNNAPGLTRTIESVINQNFSDFEFIIIDGGSTDESVEIIKSYSDRIDYWISEPDSGIYNAINKGISEAKGGYLYILNSGDFFYDNDVLREVNDYKLNRDIIFGNIFEEADNISYIIYQPESLNFNYFVKQGIYHQSIFYRRELHRKFGYYSEEFSIVSDWVFFLKILSSNNNSYKHIPLIIAKYNRLGISCNPVNWKLILEEKERFLEEEFPFFACNYYENEILKEENRKLMANNSEYKKVIDGLLSKKIKNFIKSKPHLYDIILRIKNISRNTSFKFM